MDQEQSWISVKTVGLYCASENDGEPRCGDELAGQANAVRSADLKIPIGQGKARLIELPVING